MLTDQLKSQGERLFRWRSFLPLVLLPLVAVAMLDFSQLFDLPVMIHLRVLGSLAVAALGLVFRAATVGFVPRGTSGRGTKAMSADALNTSGAYSVVRHPLYVANYLIFLAFLLSIGNLWLVLVGTLAYWMYYERIMVAEEAFLQTKYQAQVEQWAQETPAVFPRWRLWKRPDLRFSWASVIRREYTTWFVVIAVLTGIKFADDLVAYREVILDPAWAAIFLAGLAVYLGCRTAKKMNWLPATER